MACGNTGWTTRQLRPTLDRLVADGLLRYEWRRSRHTWAITPPGKRRAAPFSELPESPQHSTWQRARTLAEQEIERVWTRALDSIELAEDALNNPKVETTAQVYRDLGGRLRVAFEDMASATYCLNEWAEPDDARADLEMWDVQGLRRTHWSGDRDDVALPSSRKRPLLSLGLARAIRELRTVDAAQLGVEAGVPGWQMQALEEGRFSPGVGMLLRLAGALNVTAAEVMRRAEALDAEA